MKTKFYFKLKQGKSLILLISLCYYSGYSQDPCGLKEVMQNLYDSNPSYYSNISSGRSTCSNNAPYQIPVVFHILHNNGAENID
ncbi:MAG: hypothetical protein LCH44_14405 [Bacteroidetes bacterium]|jgi:hypothetical protein|nr:hypothetical protein [Bacteroidota bacterium]MCB0605530.1 hypothetical protein [Saprospiraceae bacterium]